MADMVLRRSTFMPNDGDEGWGSLLTIHTDEKGQLKKRQRWTNEDDIKVAHHYINFLNWQFD